MKSSSVELARRYVEASNEHDLERIGAMFVDDAVYVSSRVGAFEGVDAIIAMMDGFFERFPDVHWDVEEYREEDAGAVVFDFVMKATSDGEAEAIEVRGVETIGFDGLGRINRIEVSA